MVGAGVAAARLAGRVAVAVDGRVGCCCGVDGPIEPAVDGGMVDAEAGGDPAGPLLAIAEGVEPAARFCACAALSCCIWVQYCSNGSRLC